MWCSRPVNAEPPRRSSSLGSRRHRGEIRCLIRDAEMDPVMARHADSSPFLVLFVCTGNICRSPVGEQLFRARADEVARDSFGLGDASAALQVASAGVHARDGDRMTSQAADLSLRYGADPVRHASKRLIEWNLENAGLVLGATRNHRREIVSMYPRASRITFTITEFARLFDDLLSDATAVDALRAQVGSAGVGAADVGVAGVGAAGFGTGGYGAAVVAAVSARRGLVRPDRASDDDVVDPYRRSQKTYDAVGTVLDEAMTSMKRNFEALLP